MYVCHSCVCVCGGDVCECKFMVRVLCVCGMGGACECKFMVGVLTCECKFMLWVLMCVWC